MNGKRLSSTQNPSAQKDGKIMDNFIAENGLVKRKGFDEWYHPDNKTRVVKVGERYRLDVKIKNWSAFYSDYIVGPRDRFFKSVVGRRRW